MSSLVRLTLQPLGVTLSVPRGASLQDVLFPHGVEFPCGGNARCRGCRVKVLAGNIPLTPHHAKLLTEAEIAAGWRMACLATAEEDLVLELAQWDTPVLADDSSFQFTPRPGYGIAIDLGTTTIAAQILDLQTGRVLANESALNVQARHGADVMNRVQYALHPSRLQSLTSMIRQQLYEMICRLVLNARLNGKPIGDIAIVGNTVMHHLFCGISVEPLSHYPFEPVDNGLREFKASELNWSLSGDPVVRFLPCLGGFVGSDILAGILATRMPERDDLTVLIDLGTNGEIAVGSRSRILCASTAAGPAFEGARISKGMRAATGAIWEVGARDGKLTARILGGGTPRGICGSGLVDAAAACLALKLVHPTGRIAQQRPAIEIAPPITLSQADFRELQLAKGAIAAGVRILLERWDAKSADVKTVFLAGAFGNYINRSSALRIGLLNFQLERIQAAGNTALRGAKIALFMPDRGACADLLPKIQHISLSSDPQFQDFYVEEMGFPEE